MALPDAKHFLPSTMIGKRDYGVKIAKAGYDVRFADDTELLYNSSFPVLSIAKTISSGDSIEVMEEGVKTVWDNYSGTNINTWVYKARYLHGLEYVPMVVRNNYYLLDYNYNYDENYYWDDRYVYVDLMFYSAGDYNSWVSSGRKIASMTVFAVNIEVDVEYPYFDYVGEQVGWGDSYDYGFKYIVEGDETNVDIKDLGLNPNIQSLMVTAVKVTNNREVYAYKPEGIEFNRLSVFSFLKKNGYWTNGGPTVQGISGYRAVPSDGYYYIDGTQIADVASLVVIRMPFIAPDKISYSINM